MSSERNKRQESNSDQIGISRTKYQPESELKTVERKLDDDSLGYSESEQLQFSQPPKESAGPRGPIMADISEQRDVMEDEDEEQEEEEEP